MAAETQEVLPTGGRRKKVIIGAIVSLLVAGAIIAGVLGSRKANKIAKPNPKSAIKPLEYNVVDALFHGNQMALPANVTTKIDEAAKGGIVSVGIDIHGCS